MKTCHKCGNPKELDEFPANKTKKDGRSETCLVCKREYNRKHYEANKGYYIDKSQKRKNLARQLFKEYKSKLKCGHCGQDHPATLQFHHKDPSEKKFTISTAIGRNWPLSKIEEEIVKCEVLCANCHAILHWEDKMSGGCGGST
jgi:hypothetical protein